MAKSKAFYVCESCAYQTPKWLGQCPACGTWGSLNLTNGTTRKAAPPGEAPKMTRYANVAVESAARYTSGSNELDRVLGGGLVPGSLLLIGGDPGIGKSTLMLQVAGHLQSLGKKVIYISGEESLSQIKMRGERLGLSADDLMLLAETSYEMVEQALESDSFDVALVDSIQTICSANIPSAAGSVTQVREVTTKLLHIAKTRGTTIFLVGHITKEGAIAGPKTLEHMVDGVFYFEGDKYHSLRLIRSQKNRFGPAQELGIFQMESTGLKEVPNPSKVLLEQRPEASAGSVVVPTVEGSRPLMVEVQVLLSNSTYASPRRVTMGVDSNRLALIMAVLEKKAGLQLQGLDVFVNVVGGIAIQEPAIDLGLALAIYSSFRNLNLGSDIAVFGELGLAGEVRSVSQAGLRMKECVNLGFKRVVGPKGNAGDALDELEVRGVTSLVDALEYVL
ncbi:DNA repair protein RadA [Sulfidibacter corallicola]|uniref:DNA repair protein RadA n=1 Tax=Sulfidibacter corallicola TaxID=2818388 RepID=UPI001F017FC3|nr:DNA repair protein RadA [Sulfidibacter corallicola]